MAKNKGKTLILNTLLLIFCCVIVGLYCLNPIKEVVEQKFSRLTFDSEGGTAVAALEVPECEKVEQPPNPTREGYIFIGWMLDGELYDFEEGVCGDVELKAAWKEMEPEKVYFTITYNTGGGTEISPSVVEEGTIPSKPADPKRDGYNFKGWTLNGQAYNFDTPVTGDSELVAVWEEIPKEPEKPDQPEKPDEPTEPKKYTVTFNGNGGNLGGTNCTQTVEENKYPVTGCTASRSNYDFVGWNTNKSATSAQNITKVKITKNTTFYAIWKAKQVEPPVVEKVTLSFNLNGGVAGGTGNCKAVQINKDTAVTYNDIKNKYCAPTRQYYDLDGWNYKSGIVVNSDTEFVAKWKPAKITVTCTKPPGAAVQTCNVSASGVPNNLISKVAITVNGREVVANNGQGGVYIFTHSVWERRTSCSITVDGVEHTC